MFQKNIAIKVTASILFFVCFNIFGLVCQVGAQTITGKVVGFADDDTITVLQDRTQHKIRLYGIDTPGERPGIWQNRKRLPLGHTMATRDQNFFITLPASILIAKTVSLDSIPGKGNKGWVSTVWGCRP